MSGRVVLESQSRECGPPVNQVELSAGGCASAVDKTRFLVGCANGAFLAAGVLHIDKTRKERKPGFLCPFLQAWLIPGNYCV